jgi:hypothetical protein
VTRSPPMRTPGAAVRPGITIATTTGLRGSGAAEGHGCRPLGARTVAQHPEVRVRQPGEAFHNTILTNKTWLPLKRRHPATRLYEI